MWRLLIWLQAKCSPARQDDRLRSLAGLPSDAGHVGEVCAPLTAVEAVLPELTHTDTLHAPSIPSFTSCTQGCWDWTPEVEAHRLQESKQAARGILAQAEHM